MRAALLALLVALPGPAWAQQARDPDAATAESADRGVLRLQIDPGARVVVDDDTRDRVFSVTLWRQTAPLGAQLRGVDLAGLAAFGVVDQADGAQRLDLRLRDDVRGTSVVRRGPDVLEIQLSSRLFAGAAVRVERQQTAAREQVGAGEPDAELGAILAETLPAAQQWVEVPPFLFPVGRTTPVREAIEFAPHGRTWGLVPPVIRDAWATDDRIAAAIREAEEGAPDDAARSLHGYPTPDDPARVLLALARGWIWAQPVGPTRAPASAGNASEALQLASALAPDAEWAPWARARAAYHLEWERRYDEALLLYRQAIQAAPDHRERPYWEIGVGIALIGRGRGEEGVAQVAKWAGVLGAHEEDFQFEARRAVLYALWELGEPERAARVLDLLTERHPSRATTPDDALHWGLLLLDAGRPAEARPHLDTVERLAERRVVRERARWWLHEAAMATGDQLEARRALRRLLAQTPGSALGPLAKVRLQALDLVGTPAGERAMGWPEFALVLEREALLWPHTVLELEALSMTAQILMDAGLLEEGLRMYSWVEDRGGDSRGAIAFDEIVCRFAPVAFRSLERRGHAVAALGLWRTYLEGPEQRACVDPAIRAEAAATALSSGLPDLALSWLGQAVAEGQSQTDEATYLLTMARVFLDEGRPEAARRTLRFIEAGELPADPGAVAEAWGDVTLAEGDALVAVSSYDRALGSADPGDGARIASLRMRRGQARLQAGQPALAEADLTFALDQGGAENAAGGWLLVAGLRQKRAEAASDPSFRPLDDVGRDAWRATLDAADKALAASPVESQRRSATWHRASALLGLGDVDAASALLDELADEGDVWGLLAKNRRSSLALEQDLDARTTERAPR